MVLQLLKGFLEASNEVEKLKSGITLSKTEKVIVYRIKKNAYIKYSYKNYDANRYLPDGAFS